MAGSSRSESPSLTGSVSEVAAGETIADTSRGSEVAAMETDDPSWYEQASDHSFSDESLDESCEGVLAIHQHFLPIHFCTDILKTDTNPGNDVPFDFLRP